MTVAEIFAQSRNGTDGYHRHWCNRRFIYTDGIKEVADTAGAYWLLDIIATEAVPAYVHAYDKGFGTYGDLEMTVKKGKAWVKLSLDDDQPAAWSKHISYTDFPEGTWKFLLAQDGLLDPSRTVTVMLLISEH